MANLFDEFKKKGIATSAAMLAANEKKDFSDGSWKLEMDKETGQGQATIRLLPNPEADLPYITYYNHFFKGDDGKWCIVERCGRSFDEECPICKINTELYNSGDEILRKKASERRGRLTYVFNVLVKDDRQHPENNGKVFHWKCGKQLFQLIMDAMVPQFEGEEIMDIFNLYEGHDLILRIKKDPAKQNLPQYDRSQFDRKATPVANSDEELEEIFNQIKSLNEFKVRGKLSVEQVEAKAKSAYCNTPVPSFAFAEQPKKVSTPKKEITNEFDTELPPWDTQDIKTVTETPKTQKQKVEVSSTDDDDDESWFRELANSI